MNNEERKIISEKLAIIEQHLNLAMLELKLIKENVDYNDVVFQHKKRMR